MHSEILSRQKLRNLLIREDGKPLTIFVAKELNLELKILIDFNDKIKVDGEPFK